MNNEEMIIDPADLVKELADKTGIQQLSAIAKAMRGEPVDDVKLAQENEELKRKIQCMEEELSYKKGEIAGLRFAIRCDGVSGAEVR